jgi:hypothetical protein
MSKNYPGWQSRWYEQHGHNDYDIYIDTQRFGLIDKNVRELAAVIVIEKVEYKNDGYGNASTTWKLIRYVDHVAYEKGEGTKETLSVPYDVRKNYNHQSCKPKHFEGFFGDDDDFDLTEHEPLEHTKEGYIRKLTQEDDEYPPGFYGEKVAA